jgi:predicted O-methyltransferase YrrM
MTNKRVKRLLSRSLIAPLQVRSELIRLAKIIRDLNPRSLLEIGTFKGGTLFVLVRACQNNSVIISVDLAALSPLRRTVLRTFGGRARKIHFLTADSHSPDTFDSVSKTLQGSLLDVLFIDGDHSYAGVKRDFDMYAPLVRRGGLVAFHDIAEHPPEAQCEVSLFWHEVRSRYKHLEIIEDREQGWAGIGVLYV